MFTQQTRPAVRRPGFALAVRFASLIAIAALCLWADGTTRALAIADHGWDVATGPVGGSWPPVVFHNNRMPVPAHWYWPLLAAGVVWVTWFGVTSRAWCHTLAAGLVLGGVLGNAAQWWYAGFVVDWIAIVRPGGFIMVNVADIALVAGYCFVLLPFVLTRISTRSAPA